MHLKLLTAEPSDEAAHAAASIFSFRLSRTCTSRFPYKIFFFVRVLPRPTSLLRRQSSLGTAPAVEAITIFSSLAVGPKMASGLTEGDTGVDLSSLSVQDSTSELPQQPTPPHLSHDPENNLKRSDPFQFGSRHLKDEANVFEFNAWDHVETDDVYKEYAELQYAKQREAPVSDFDKSKPSHLLSLNALSRLSPAS